MMTISEIVEQLKEFGINPIFLGDITVEITGFSDPRDYVPGTAIWVGRIGDISLSDNIDYSDISLCFAKTDSGIEKYLPNIILCNDPKNAFMKLVKKKYNKTPIESISKNTVISDSAKIGKNCLIADFVVIEDGVEIGDNCIIRENSFIGEKCIIGNNCTIGQNCVISGETNGSVFEDSDGVMKDMPNVGIVRIGNGVRIGAGCIISKATFTETVIGDECEINSGSSIGHNVKIGKRSMLLGKNSVNGNVRIGCNTQLISSIVKNRIIIGDNVKVGIGSVVINDIKDGQTVMGNPARVFPK